MERATYEVTKIVFTEQELSDFLGHSGYSVEYIEKTEDESGDVYEFSLIRSKSDIAKARYEFQPTSLMALFNSYGVN